MAERVSGGLREDNRVLGGILALVIVGSVLGIAFNANGQRSEPGWSIAWIGEDRMAVTGSLSDLQGADGPASLEGASDDPMAMAGGGADLTLPDLDRPIKANLEQVKRFFDADAALFADARDPDEFALGHIARSINLPYDVAAGDPAMLEQLDTGGRPVVVYCGGGDCELSMNLAYDLFFAGHTKVLVYEGGYPEWEAAGFPVAGGPAEGP
jgi:rhodanese-related sulfurtransferase